MSSDTQELLISRSTTLDTAGEAADEDLNSKVFEQLTLLKKAPQTIATKFFALGGIGEIGKNTYCFEHDDEIILIDAGIKFVNKKLYPGLTGCVPGVDYLIKNQHKIKALFITHGHEDHIGGIAHMLKKVSIPMIYSPVLCSELIKRKLNEHGFRDQPISLYTKKSIFKTEHFMVDFFKVNHSIPDAYGVCVITPNGTVVSSGDFRFDFGSKSDKFDLQKLQQIALRKVDLLLCESTNSEQPGFNESEKVVISELNNIISSSKGRIIITFFASNLARIEEIIKIAINSNRKIVIIGRSIESSLDASQKIGYLKINKKVFISNSEIVNYEDHQILIICTGSQGEENAVLNNISKNKHQWIKLKPTDNIIFSSNVIPGNTSSVEEVINRLYKSGCNIFTNSPQLKIHSSGHASKLEQQLFISLVNPNFLIPIHGETRMLKELKRSAVELGFSEKNIFIMQNGQIALLFNNKVTVTDEIIDTEPLFIVGNDVSDNGLKVLKEREILGREGILLQHMFLDIAKKEIHTLSPVTNVGSFYLSDSIQMLKKINTVILDNTKALLKEPGMDEFKLSKACANILADEIYKFRKQKPTVKFFVTNVPREKLFETQILSKELNITTQTRPVNKADQPANTTPTITENTTNVDVVANEAQSIAKKPKPRVKKAKVPKVETSMSESTEDTSPSKTEPNKG